MSGATKISGELQAGTSGTTDSSAMETEEYYNPEGGEWSQKVDTGQLCRVCANPNEYLIPIFDGEGLEHELSVKIEKHLPIKVTETDALPQQMCYQCASTLIAWHDLVLNCVEADKKLRELQADEDDDDDDKGAEMFESHSMDSDPADEVDQPSTSESQITAKLQVPKKTVLSKDKKPKLKMVLVKGSLAGTSGQKTVAKTQVAKALELAKSKEGGNEDSASERSKGSSKNEIIQIPQLKEDCSYLLHCKSNEEIQDDLSAFELFNKEHHHFDLTKNNGIENINYQNSDDLYFTDKSADTLENMKKQSVECSYCDKEFASTSKQHLQIEQNECKEFQCEICDETFISLNEFHVHKRVHTKNLCVNGEDLVHLCHTCGKIFNSLSKLRNHDRRTHQEVPEKKIIDKKQICEVCGKEFQFIKYLKKHMLKHGEKNFVCETCGKRFETKYMLKMHQECHSEIRPYICKICRSSYKRHRNLLSHEQEVHGIFSLGPGKEKESLSFPCDLCKKEFTTRKKVAVHMRTHTGERPFQCQECGNKYTSRSSLYIHRRVVHEGRKCVERGIFLCDVCSKSFATKHYLDIHLRIHTGEKPYVCKVCSRAFTQRTSLVNHMATHTDSRPYSCTQCDKAFRRRETLVVHIRTHTGEKPHVCNVCGRGFAQLTDMKKHRMKIHHYIQSRKQ